MRIAFRSTGPLLVLLVIFASIMSAPAGAGAKAIGTAELHRMVMDNAYALEAGRALPYVIVDARPREEYDKGHIFGSISIPAKDMEQSTASLPKGKDAVLAVYCSEADPGACSRWSEKAADAGYTNVVVYSEGFAAWKAKHMPVAP